MPLYTYVVELQDNVDDTDNPRNMDNVGTILYRASRYGYTLGDRQGTDEEIAAVLASVEDGCVLALPMRVYIHSGITVSVTDAYPYNDQWDSAFCGVIYCDLDDVRASWPNTEDEATLRRLAYDCLRSEVESFDAYLRGDVYCYRIFDTDGNEVKAVYGYIGDEQGAGVDARFEAECFERSMAVRADLAAVAGL